MTIAERIKHRRAELGWSQHYAGKRLGVDLRTIARWEAGLETPDPSYAPALSSYLGIEHAIVLAGIIHEIGEISLDETPADAMEERIAALERRVAELEGLLARVGDSGVTHCD